MEQCTTIVIQTLVHILIHIPVHILVHILVHITIHIDIIVLDMPHLRTLSPDIK